MINESTDLSLEVKQTSNGCVKFNINRIIDTLVVETSMNKEKAIQIAKKIEKQIKYLDIKNLTSSLIRELVDTELISQGLLDYRDRHARLGLSAYDVDKIIALPNNENSNIPHSPEEINLHLAGNIIRQYALLNVFSKKSADAHNSGDIHIHDLDMVMRPYTYMGDETVIVKDDKKNIKCISLKTLFNLCEVHYDIPKDKVTIGMIKDWFILDKDFWVSIKRVVKRLKMRPMYWTKTVNSRSLIVTDNHPYMVLDDDDDYFKKVLARDLVKGQKVFSMTKFHISSNVSNIDLTDVNLCANNSNRVYYLNNVIIRGYENTKEIINNLTVKEYRELVNKEYELDLSKSCIYSKALEGNTAAKSLPTILKLTEDFCYMVGLFIAKGHYEEHSISFTCNELYLSSTIRALEALNIHYTVQDHNDRGCKCLRVYSTILHDVFLNYFKIDSKLRDMCLPDSVISWNPELAFSLLCGIIDGSGTIWNNRILIRSSSRQILNQINWLLMSQKIKGCDSKNGSAGSIRKYKERVITQKYDTFCISFTIFPNTRYLFKNSIKCKNVKNATKICSKAIDYIQVIQPIEIQDKYIYDITTESGTFMCNGIYSKNCSGHSLEYVKKYGLSLPSSLSSAAPAKSAIVLLSHMVKFAVAMQGCFAGAIGWAAVNTFFSPFLVGMSYKNIKQLAQMLVYEFAQQAVGRGGQVCFTDLNVSYEVPSYLSNVQALGPGGELTGKTYKDYKNEAQQFLKALLEVYMEGDCNGTPFLFPKILLNLTDDFFKTSGWETCLHQACDLASDKGSTYFVFNRGKSAKVSECCFTGETLISYRYSDVYYRANIRDICNKFKKVEIKTEHGYKEAITVISQSDSFVTIYLNNGKLITATSEHIMVTDKGDLAAGHLSSDIKLKYYNTKEDITYYIGIDKIIKYRTNIPIPVYCFNMVDRKYPYFMLDNGIIVHNCRLKFELDEQDYKDAKEPWKLRFAAMQNITLNLPRIGYEAKGDDDKLFTLISTRMDLIAEAHIQKRDYIKRLLDLKEKGPLALLLMNKDSNPYLRWNKITYLIGIVGLNELARAHLGIELHENKQALEFGLQVIAYMYSKAKELSKKYNMKFLLEESPFETGTYRLAKLDLKKYPDIASKYIQGDIPSKNVYYTNSIHYAYSSNISFPQRITDQGKFSKLIEAGSISHIWLGEHKPPAEALMKVVINTYNKTSCEQIAFSPEFTICNTCKKTSRGLLESCPQCHSKDVDGITRITGYFSKVSSWNKGKKEELKDRLRENVR